MSCVYDFMDLLEGVGCFDVMSVVINPSQLNEYTVGNTSIVVSIHSTKGLLRVFKLVGWHLDQIHSSRGSDSIKLEVVVGY